MQQEPLPILVNLGLVWIVAVFLALQFSAALIFYGAGTLRNVLSSRRRDEELRLVAKELSLVGYHGTFRLFSVAGFVSGFQLRLEPGRGAIRVSLSSSRIPADFSVWEVEPRTAHTGDPTFDTKCFARGEAVQIASRLDAKTRAWFVQHRATCIDRSLSFYLPLGGSRAVAEVRDAVSIAEHLASAAMAPSLGAIAEQDPMPAVRENAVELLTRSLPTTSEAHRIFRLWLVDPSCPARRRERARLFLEREPSLDEEIVLTLILDSNGDAVLRRLLAIGQPVERLLARLVPRVLENQSTPLLDGLATFGTAASVEPLRGAGVLPGGALAARIADTIERIQKRLEGAGHGQLALSQGGGELMIDEERGAVAIVVTKPS